MGSRNPLESGQSFRLVENFLSILAEVSQSPRIGAVLPA